mmetsp:Transcript_36380/g.94462  ORF Transcript_36380/g.94462 Transcript_36380/m.94462 type:complete len:94 (+) Transcript_36380:98-379(+)
MFNPNSFEIITTLSTPPSCEGRLRCTPAPPASYWDSLNLGLPAQCGIGRWWKQGFRHKRISKPEEQCQWLGRPAVVFKAYAKVMKRLGALKAI